MSVATILALAMPFCGAETLAETAEGSRPLWIGVRVCSKGMAVQEVFPGSPAELTGIQVGETIYKVHEESNPGDIFDDISGLRPGDPIIVVAGKKRERREISLIPAPRPERIVASGTEIFLAEPVSMGVEPDDPRAPMDCHSNCYTTVGPCEAVTLESQGPNILMVRWRKKLITCEGNFWGRVFTEKAACLAEAKAGCQYFL